MRCSVSEAEITRQKLLAYGRGFRWALELIFMNPPTRVLIASSCADGSVKSMLRNVLEKHHGKDAVEGFDSL